MYVRTLQRATQLTSQSWDLRLARERPIRATRLYGSSASASSKSLTAPYAHGHSQGSPLSFEISWNRRVDARISTPAALELHSTGQPCAGT